MTTLLTLARLALAAGALTFPALRAQTQCFDQGSVLVPAMVTASPLPLGCTGASDWPMWHLLTPAHREPAPHAGYYPGEARALPQILARWRCTGWLFSPVAFDGFVRMGYVIDRAEYPCVTT